MGELNVIGTPASAMWSFSATVLPWSGPESAPLTRHFVMNAPSGSSSSEGRRPGRGGGEGRGRPPLLHAHLVERLERGDRVHHAGLDQPRLGRGEIESQ